MAIQLEAILAIEDSLSNRLGKTWRRESVKYKSLVNAALAQNDPVAAQAIADSIDMSPVFEENKEFIRMQTYASLLHGATRLTEKARNTVITTGIYDSSVDKILTQFKSQIVGGVTEQVKKELTKVIQAAVDGTENVSETNNTVLKYSPQQARYPKGHPKGGQWKGGGIASGDWGAAFGAGVGDSQEEMRQWLKDNPDSPPPPTASASQLAELGAIRESEPRVIDTDGDAIARALGMDPEDLLQKLVDEQAAFSNAENKGIRVDATLTGDKLPMTDLTNMMEFFPEQSFEGFALRQGEPFVVPDSPPQIDLREPKMCFMNASKESGGMSFNDKYDYVEGYVMDNTLPFPIHHAWVTERGSNKVVDHTLGWRPTAAYYGVKFEDDFVRSKLVENGYYGLFTDGMRPHKLVLGEDEEFDYK